LTACVAGLLGTAVLAQDGDKPLPEIQVDAVFNLKGYRHKTLHPLRASAVYLEYWQTW
jgi:hypothetical protein